MLPQNDYLIQREVLDYTVHEMQADAAQRRLVHAAGIKRPSWLSCQVCRALMSLGRAMIAAGSRLEQRYSPTGA